MLSQTIAREGTSAIGVSPAATTPPRTSGVRRATRIAAAVVAGLFLAFEAYAHGAWALALVGLLVPDLTMLRAVGSHHAPGQLSPRAVPLYNAAHRLWIPLALIAAACVPPDLTAPYILGLAWATHILIDRAAGYGLRSADGFRHPL